MNNMKRIDVKSHCPVNFSLEIFGDPWSLLIVRSMLTYNAKTYSDFQKIKERIGTSVLAHRLVHLEKNGIITKHIDEDDRRKTRYALTSIGLDLIPIIYDLSVWGTNTSPSPDAAEAWYNAMTLDRDTVIDAWRIAVENGSAFYVGPQSVVAQLCL